MDDPANPNIYHLPGGIALVVTLYKSLISRHGKRIEKLEELSLEFQTKEEAANVKSELRSDIAALRTDLGGKLDTVISALLTNNGR